MIERELERERKQRNRELQLLMLKQRILGVFAVILAVVLFIVLLKYPVFDHPDDVSGIMLILLLGIVLCGSGSLLLDDD